MQNFKLFIDIISSISAIVAIVSVLSIWWRGTKPPIKIKRVLFQKEENGSCRFITEINNKKEYPIKINKIEAYRHRLYRVERKRGSKPRAMDGFDLKERIYISREEVKIYSFGEEDITVTIENFTDYGIKQVYFLLNTSHGYYVLKTKNILEVNMGFEMIALAFKQRNMGKTGYYLNYLRAYLAYKVEGTFLSKYLSKYLDSIKIA